MPDIIKLNHTSIDKYYTSQSLFKHDIDDVIDTISERQILLCFILHSLVDKVGTQLEDYKLKIYGSKKITSDIDITVEGPYPSKVIKLIEDTWLEKTGKYPTDTEIEFYGDFITLLSSNPVFINSREFTIEHEADILPYVGVSILRNAGSLDFPLLNNFLHKYPQPGPWKETARHIFDEIKHISKEESRHRYYKYLHRAEKIKRSAINRQNTHLIFLTLCKANMYRSENYILPSTVIHVVRKIQDTNTEIKSNHKRTCKLYHPKRPSCSLGKFTYLCSAMEQIGYIEKNKNNYKIQKYTARMEDALRSIQSIQE